MDAQKQKILDFLKKEQLMVISTINDKGMPESAVVGFTETSDFEIIFGTSSLTRKYKNLQTNKRISLVIGWSTEERITIQYEGIAEEITENDIEQYRELHITKSPSRAKYIHNANERMFTIKPLWVRYTQLTKDGEIFEINF